MAAPGTLVAALVATMLCVGSTGACANSADAKATAPSFRLVGAHVAASTGDGRFALTEARVAVSAAQTTPDGRFSLIETRQPEVGCDPFPEQLFANGFE